MKRFILATLAALALLGTPSAKAWNYNSGDVLLVFRNGSQDVEYDLGSVTNLLGHTNGYTTIITGWDPTLVTSTFGGFSGLSVALIATSGGTNWVTSAELQLHRLQHQFAGGANPGFCHQWRWFQAIVSNRDPHGQDECLFN